MQDNILTLACYSEKSCKLVRNSIDVKLFTSRVYRTIIQHAYNYIDQFDKPPKDHLMDELEGAIENDEEFSEAVLNVVTAARELSTNINEEYVLTQLRAFVRQQSLKMGIMKAHEKIQLGDIDGAEVELSKAVKARSEVFDPGLKLTDVVKILNSGEDFRDCIATGIKILDRLGLGPARKELHLFIGPPKRGKSWWLTHMTKRALMQRWRGVYVTLELADRFVGKRMLQSQLALTSRVGTESTFSRLIKSDKDELEDIEEKELLRPSIADPEISTMLRSRVDALRIDDKLFIKEFATGSLTVRGLEAYLESLERVHNFIPDFLTLDYADLMQVDAKNYRQELGAVYKDLRGLAVDRNLALITASQSNRAGADAKLLSDTHVAEDFSKIATADCVITYNQTAAERTRNIARLFVANGRVEADKFAVLITQSYASGQFALDSVMMKEEYWTFFKTDDEDEDD